MPAMHLMSVDLPAPLSPTSAMTSPERTSKSTSVNACTEPNVFERSRISRSGVSLTSVGPSRKERWRRANTPPPLPARLPAVLLVLPGADLAPLQELVPEEPGVVRLGDRDHRDHHSRLLLALVRPRRVGRRLLALVEGDRRGNRRVRLGGHVLVDRVGLPARDDVLHALHRRVLPRERDGLEPLRLQGGDNRACDVVVRRDGALDVVVRGDEELLEDRLRVLRIPLRHELRRALLDLLRPEER